MEIKNDHGRMREIEIFGIPALLTFEPVAHDAVYPGMFRYELRAGDSSPEQAQFVAQTAETGFLGTVLTPVPIPMMEDGERELEDGDLILDTEAGYYTPEEFEAKYLSPDYEADRFGKPD